jgi:RimJ/RimL family protein N-acetyltransferase
VATRAAHLLAAWVLDELCVDVVVARCDPANPASAGVARAAGFTEQEDGVWTFAGGAGRGTVPS